MAADPAAQALKRLTARGTKAGSIRRAYEKALVDEREAILEARNAGVPFVDIVRVSSQSRRTVWKVINDA